MTIRARPQLSDLSRELVGLADRRVLVRAQRHRPKSPGGAFVVIAAAMGSPAAETAEVCGLAPADVRELVTERGVYAPPPILARLACWAIACWVRAAGAAGEASLEARSALLAAAWAGHLAPWIWEGGRGGKPPRNLPPSFGNGGRDG